MKQKLLIRLSAISLLLIAINFQSTAQVHVDTNFKNAINTTFADLDKNKIPNGLLLDYSMDFTNVEAYNGH